MDYNNQSYFIKQNQTQNPRFFQMNIEKSPSSYRQWASVRQQETETKRLRIIDQNPLLKHPKNVQWNEISHINSRSNTRESFINQQRAQRNQKQTDSKSPHYIGLALLIDNKNNNIREKSRVNTSREDNIDSISSGSSKSSSDQASSTSSPQNSAEQISISSSSSSDESVQSENKDTITDIGMTNSQMLNQISIQQKEVMERLFQNKTESIIAPLGSRKNSFMSNSNIQQHNTIQKNQGQITSALSRSPILQTPRMNLRMDIQKKLGNLDEDSNSFQGFNVQDKKQNLLNYNQYTSDADLKKISQQPNMTYNDIYQTEFSHFTQYPKIKWLIINDNQTDTESDHMIESDAKLCDLSFKDGQFPRHVSPRQRLYSQQYKRISSQNSQGQQQICTTFLSDDSQVLKPCANKKMRTSEESKNDDVSIVSQAEKMEISEISQSSKKRNQKGLLKISSQNQKIAEIANFQKLPLVSQPIQKFKSHQDNIYQNSSKINDKLMKNSSDSSEPGFNHEENKEINSQNYGYIPPTPRHPTQYFRTQNQYQCPQSKLSNFTVQTSMDNLFYQQRRHETPYFSPNFYQEKSQDCLQNQQQVPFGSQQKPIMIDDEISVCQMSQDDNRTQMEQQSDSKLIEQRQNKKQKYFYETLEKAKQLSCIFKGSVKSVDQFSICKGLFSIKFCCQNEHNFFLTAEQINKIDIENTRNKFKSYRLRLQELHNQIQQNSCQSPCISLDLDSSCWCIRCTEYFDHCLNSFNYKNLQLIGGLFTKQIMYKCRAFSHIFYVNSLRKHKFQKQYRIQDQACSECKHIQKENERKQAAQQEEEQNRLLAQKQSELFEESRREMARQERINQSSQLAYFLQKEKQINQEAKHEAEAFLKNCSRFDHEMDSNSSQKPSYSQVFLTYKILLTPIKLFKKGLELKRDLKKYYRNISRQIHPDKNNHPLAKEAFQKVSECYQNQLQS